jgi:hypothetical protein
MLNGIAGLQDELNENEAPEEAIRLCAELFQICNDHFRSKYGDGYID